jgi:phytoene dehydrogenase-like protein
LLAGNAAHSILPLDRPLATNAVGLMLMLVGHAYGWPIAKGGSQAITDAMVSHLRKLGGEVETGKWVGAIDELPAASSYVFDTSTSAMARIAGDRLPDVFRKKLNRFRHGPGIFKIDYALSDPVPWINSDCRRAGTVHVGGSLDEIVRSEREMWEGIHSDEPFVLTSQPTVSDPSRAPEGKHVFWAYCHVPAGSELDRTEVIERQIERFAPGFRDCVLERNTMNCADYEAYNPNLIGGDIVGGVTDWRQLLTRPVVSLRPHTTPDPEIFLCSSSTPPGAGVHGMGGFWAAESVIDRTLNVRAQRAERANLS